MLTQVSANFTKINQFEINLSLTNKLVIFWNNPDDLKDLFNFSKKLKNFKIKFENVQELGVE